MFGAATDPGGTKLYRRNRETNKKNKKNIMFVLDLSGSMSGHPVRSARTLLLGANKIAQKNKHLNITVLGSKVNTSDMYQTIKLPANENSLLSVEADGGSEGIGYAIENSSKEVSKNDIVVFLTDGNIHDKEISKQFIGKHLKHDAISVGIYCGNGDIHNKDMKNWFDELIVRENMSDIIERVVEIANGEKPKIVKHFHEDVEEEVSVSPSASL